MAVAHDQHRRSSASASSRSSFESNSENESQWTHDRYPNAGILKPSGSARYNFLVQKFKHRKELRKDDAEEGQQLQELQPRREK